MEISKQLLFRNIHFLAIEQLAEEYKAKGYRVKKETKIGGFQADLIAEKGDEKIVFEVKAGRMTPAKKKHLAELADYINSLGNYKFKVVIATPPKEKNIQISGIEDIIFEHLLNKLPSELDELSTHTTVEAVSDLEIHDLKIHEKNSINILGHCIVDVRIQFGSDGDARRGDGHYQYESFPMEFDLYLSYNDKGKLFIGEEINLEVNTDSYYQ